MTDMIERVAAVLAEKLKDPLDGGATITAGELARAAIAAMREPTGGMIAAAVAAIDEIPQWANIEVVEASHFAMIDAALAGGRP